MNEREIVKLLRVDDYVAEVDVTFLGDESDPTGWTPTFSINDVRKMEAVERALKEGDLSTAGKLARIFTLKPVTNE